MKNRPEARRTPAASALIALSLLATLGFILACATAPPPKSMPTSRWAGGYNFSFQPPRTSSPVSAKVNVVVVQPDRERESVFMERLYTRVGRGFSRSMGVDLDKVLTAKGMTTVGPYATLDDVTFPDKKSADLTLAPRVFVNAETRFTGSYNTTYNGVGYIEKPFVMRIAGWVSYEMREPLSAQKMWVKRLDLEEREIRGVEIYEAIAVRKDQYGNVLQWSEGQVKFSGREDALADALAAYYPGIMQRAWTYLDVAEMHDLKEKTREIRDRIQAPLR
jgi:hypothetical protein